MQVTAYQDKNGNIHRNQEDQVKADILFDLEVAMKGCNNWYNAHLNVSDINDLIEFLTDNRDIIKKALEVI